MEDGYVPGAWLRFENPNFDLGAIVTYPNALGQNVADAIGGGASIAINQPRDQSFQILGYPGANQQWMRECDPIFAKNSPLSRFYPGPAQMMATCVLAPGSSGGPWFIGEPPMLNGITSQLVRLHPYDQYITSTYFNSGMIEGLLEGL
jgi:hypothetical protein